MSKPAAAPKADDRHPNPFHEAALLVRHELLRFRLGDRNRTIAILILSLSWDEGISAVRIPKLEIFERLTGMEANHVSETLTELELQRIVTVMQTPDGKLYSINPTSSNWQATPRKPRTLMLETLNLVREINGVKRQSEDQLNFKFQEVANFLSTKTPEKGVLHKKESLQTATRAKPAPNRQPGGSR